MLISMIARKNLIDNKLPDQTTIAYLRGETEILEKISELSAKHDKH